MRNYHYFENKEEITKEREEELIDMLASKIYKHGLETPAIFMGELAKPMSFVMSSIMHGAAPVLAPVIEFRRVEEFAFLFEKRANIEKLLRRLESMIAREPRKR